MAQRLDDEPQDVFGEPSAPPAPKARNPDKAPWLQTALAEFLGSVMFVFVACGCVCARERDPRRALQHIGLAVACSLCVW